MSAQQLDAYLDRIGAGAVSAPSPDALAALHEQHLLAVPFENLDIHRGVPIILDEARILSKVVGQRRGGFCYELNTAFAWLLRGLGYRVSMLSAEVAKPDGSFGIPFDHMLLRVDFGDHAPSYLVDVGFGECFRRPLAHVPDVVTQERHAGYRVVRHRETWILEQAAAGADAFAPQYRFTTTPRQLAAFADACVHHQTSANSTFTQKRTCTRATAEGRLTLLADRLVVTANGQRTEVPIAGEDEWLRALHEHFDIRLSPAGFGHDSI